MARISYRLLCSTDGGLLLFDRYYAPISPMFEPLGKGTLCIPHERQLLEMCGGVCQKWLQGTGRGTSLAGGSISILFDEVF